MQDTIRYSGKLIFAQPLTQEQEAYIRGYRKPNGDSLFPDLLLDNTGLWLEVGQYYPNTYFIDISETINKFYDDIKDFLIEFKKLGNDFTTNSYLISCNQYGLDDTSIMLSYKTGEWVKTPIFDLLYKLI